MKHRLLNRNDIISEVSHLPVSKDMYWVVMGAALVLHGIRSSTSDIDVGCTSRAFHQLESKGKVSRTSASGLQCIDFNSIVHVYLEWPADNIIIIDDIPVVDLHSIAHDKQRLGREKDLKDLMLIAESLRGFHSS